MSKDNNKNERFLFSINSQKGGVGKTSIAIAIAGISAFANNRKTIIIDADLTGTSLRDIEGWENANEKKENLNDLLLAHPGHYKKYLNDIDKFICKIPNFNEVDFIAASSAFEEIQKIVPLISQEDHLHFFKHRLQDIILTLFKKNYECIIIDNPPGLFGLSLASLNLIFDDNDKNSDFSEKTNFTSKKAVLITTPDTIDYRSLLKNYSNLPQIKDNLKDKDKDKMNEIYAKLNLIINKAKPTDGSFFDSTFVFSKFEEHSKTIKDKNNENENTKWLLDIFIKKAEKKEAVTGCFVGNHTLENILNTCKAVSFDLKESNKDEFYEWLRSTAKTLGMKYIKEASNLK